MRAVLANLPRLLAEEDLRTADLRSMKFADVQKLAERAFDDRERAERYALNAYREKLHSNLEGF